MDATDENLADLDAPSLRQRFADLVLLHEHTEHIGRQNRIMGWSRAAADRLVDLGHGTERELLPLLDHHAVEVRLSAVYRIKPVNRGLFVTTLEQWAIGDGRLAQKARSALENLKWQEDWASRANAPEPTRDPELDRRIHWQESNPPPPPAMSQEYLKDRVLTEFAPECARQLLALARPAIGLWPQRDSNSSSPRRSCIDGQCWAPPGWQWPTCEAEPLYFLAHIYCPDLAGLPGAELLPCDGILDFFGDFDAITGCFPPGEPEQSAVYHWPEDGLVLTTPPLPLDMYTEDRRPTSLGFRPFIDLPHPSSAIAQGLPTSPAEKERYWSLWEAVRQDGIPTDVVPYCDNSSKLLGWPDLVQNDIEVPQIGTGCYRQLAQLPARMGPGGSLYFFIREVDLAQGRFGDCIMEEQNT